MMSSFSKAFGRYAADDSTFGTDKDTVHSYGHVYDRLFEEKRRFIRTVLEIGVLTGASLAAWADYFPNARVDGVDTCLDRITFASDNPRVRVFEMDATMPTSVAALRRVAAPFSKYDVIIDDGSHDPKDQLRSLRLFLPLLAPGGVYVIEDIQEETAEHVFSEVRKISDKWDMDLMWHDLKTIKGRSDDVIAVLLR